MAFTSKTRPSFLPSFPTFDERDETEGSPSFSIAFDPSSQGISHVSDLHGTAEQCQRPTSMLFVNRTPSEMESTPVKLTRARSKSVEKPLPPKPTGSHPLRELNLKTHINKLRWKPTEREEPPEQDKRRMEISEPFNPRKGVYDPAANQAWTSLERVRGVYPRGLDVFDVPPRPAPVSEGYVASGSLPLVHQVVQQPLHEITRRTEPTIEEEVVHPGRRLTVQPGQPFIVSEPWTEEDGVDSENGPDLDTSQNSLTVPGKASANHKPFIPRSTSAFSFSSSMSYVSSSLGNVFKFSSSKNKKPLFRAKLGAEQLSLDNQSRPGTDGSSSQAPAGNKIDAAIKDHEAREAISVSPQLQKFFYGKIFDDPQPAKRSADQRDPKTHESPVRARRSMYNLGHFEEDTMHAPSKSFLRVDSDSNLDRVFQAQTHFHDTVEFQTLDDPKYEFATSVNSHSSQGYGHTSRASKHARATDPQSRSLMEVDDTHRDTRSGTKENFGENISGLRQHPDVMNFAEPPAWYRDGFDNAKSAAEAAGCCDDYPFAWTSNRSRPHSIFITPDMNGLDAEKAVTSPVRLHRLPMKPWEEADAAAFVAEGEYAGSIIDPAIPSIMLQPSSGGSKRTSSDANFAAESPTKIRRSKGDRVMETEDIIAGIELLNALDDVHGAARGDYGVVATETDFPYTSKPTTRLERSDSLIVEQDPFNDWGSTPPIPPRHPGRLLRTVGNPRSDMPFAMHNVPKAEFAVPSTGLSSFTNFSNPRYASGWRAEHPRYSHLAPPTLVPQNTPNPNATSPQPTFRDRLERARTVKIEEEGSRSRNYLGIGLAE